MPRSEVLVAAKGGGFLFAGRLFAWGTRFALAVLLARLLGAEQYGLYNLALTVAAVAASLPSLGLDSALVRFTAIFRYRHDRDALHGTLQLGIGLPALLSIGAAIAIVLAADPIASGLMGEPKLAPLLAVVSLLVPALVVNRQLEATLRGFKRLPHAVLAEQFAQPIIRLAILLVFVLLGLTAGLAIAASVTAALLATVLLAAFVHRAVSLPALSRPAVRPVRDIVTFSLPVFFSNVVTTLGANLQTLLLGVLSTATAVGIFAVANQVQLVGSLFHSAVVAASMPLFAELQERGERRRLEMLYQTTSKWTFTLNLPLFLLVLAFPQAILSIFGREFEAGATALVILACANLVNAGTGTSGAVLDMTGHTRVKFVNSTLSVGLAAGLNLLLIPPLGIVGAAVAGFGAIALVNLLRLLEVAWLVRVVPYDASFLKPLAAGAVALAVGWGASNALAPLGLAVQALAGALLLLGAYGIVVLALGLTADDRAVLERIGNRLTRRWSAGKPDAAPLPDDDVLLEAGERT